MFFSPCGWWNALGSGADVWQRLWASRMAWQQAGAIALRLTWVRRLFGHKASACRLYWEPANDGLAYVSACWEALLLFWSSLWPKKWAHCSNGLWLAVLISDLSTWTWGQAFWLCLWAVWIHFSPPSLCVRLLSSFGKLLNLHKPDEFIPHLPPLSYCSHHCLGITARQRESALLKC